MQQLEARSPLLLTMPLYLPSDNSMKTRSPYNPRVKLTKEVREQLPPGFISFLQHLDGSDDGIGGYDIGGFRQELIRRTTG